MAGVNFTIEVKEKGIQFVEKYRKELEEVQKSTGKLVEENKKLDKSSDQVVKNNKNISQSLENLNKNIEKNESKFKKYGGTVVASLAVISAAVGASIINISKALNGQVLAAEKLNLSFDVFQSLSVLTKKYGEDLDQVGDKLYDFSKDIDEALIRKSGPAYEALKELGIGLEELAGVDTITRLEKISKVLNELPDANKKNFYLDEFKLKDISLVAENIGEIRDINDDLRSRGFLISEAEAEMVKNFSKDVNGLFSEYNTILTKLSVVALPEVISLLEQVGFTGEEGFDSQDIRLFNEAIVVASGSIGGAIVIAQGFFDIINFTLKAITNLGIYLSTTFPKLVEIGVTEASAVMSKLGSIGSTINENLNKGAAGIARAIGADEYAKLLDNQAAKEKAVGDKRRKNKEQLNREILQLNKEFDDLLSDANNTFISSTETDIDRLLNNANKRAEDIKRQFEKIASPGTVLNNNEEEIEKRNKELEEERKRKEKERLDAYNKIINDKDGKEEKPKEINFLKEINDKITETNLKYELQKITLEERNKLLTNYYNNIRNSPEVSQIEKLKAELNIRNLLVKDYFEIIKETQDLQASGLLNEKEASEIIKKNLESIAKSDATKEEKTRALIELNNIKISQIEKEKKLQDDLFNSKNKLLRSTGDELAAFDAESKKRIEIIKKEFEESGDLAERLEIEKKLINRERLEIELSDVKRQIEELAEINNKSSFFDFDSTLKANEELIKLKEKQISLEGQLGEATKKTNEEILFTNEKVIEIAGKGLDGIAKGFGEIIAGSKSAGEATREVLADILTEINKVLIRQLALSIASSIGGSAGGGIGGGIASLLSSVARNHTGEWNVKADQTTGQYGLKQNETLRVLEVGESVLTKNQVENLSNTQSQQSTGKAVFDTEQSANAILKSNSATKFFDNLAREKGWSSN